MLFILLFVQIEAKDVGEELKFKIEGIIVNTRCEGGCCPMSSTHGPGLRGHIRPLIGPGWCTQISLGIYTGNMIGVFCNRLLGGRSIGIYMSLLCSPIS